MTGDVRGSGLRHLPIKATTSFFYSWQDIKIQKIQEASQVNFDSGFVFRRFKLISTVNFRNLRYQMKMFVRRELLHGICQEYFTKKMRVFRFFWNWVSRLILYRGIHFCHQLSDIYSILIEIAFQSASKKYFSSLRRLHFKTVQDTEFQFIPFDSLVFFSQGV